MLGSYRGGDCVHWEGVYVCVSASPTEHFKRAVCYPGPLCFKDGCLISEVWMLWKSYHVGASFEFLTAQNNFSSNARTRGQRGEGEEEHRRER